MLSAPAERLHANINVIPVQSIAIDKASLTPICMRKGRIKGGIEEGSTIAYTYYTLERYTESRVQDILLSVSIFGGWHKWKMGDGRCARKKDPERKVRGRGTGKRAMRGVSIVGSWEYAFEVSKKPRPKSRDSARARIAGVPPTLTVYLNILTKGCTKCRGASDRSYTPEQ